MQGTVYAAGPTTHIPQRGPGAGLAVTGQEPALHVGGLFGFSVVGAVRVGAGGHLHVLRDWPNVIIQKFLSEHSSLL